MQSFSDRWLRPALIRWFSGVHLLVLLVCGLATLVGSDSQGRTVFGSFQGADYGQFHAAGAVLNEGQADRLYDPIDQDRRLHALAPSLATNLHLSFANPPFVALIFRPLAYLSFDRAVATWLAITVLTYALAVWLILRDCEHLGGSDRFTAWLLALSFPPFAIECGLGGQLSSLGTLAVAIAISFQKARRPIASGLALSFLLYKPTLLVLVLPMLVVGRCGRVLVGLAVGAAILAGVSILVAGESACLDFLGLMAGYARRGGSLARNFKTIKYVDLSAFLRLIGIRRSLDRPLAIALGLVPLIGLILVWTRTVRSRPTDLAWASTFCWTPILNIYGPIYDVTLVVPGLLLAANSLRGADPTGKLPATFGWLLASIYLSSIVTQASADSIGFQPLTVSLIATGLFLIRSALRENSTFPDP